MHERAVLLPCASQVFLTEYTKDSTTDQTVHILEVRDGIRPSVDGLCRDGTGGISRERRIKRFLTRREKANSASKLDKSHSRTFL